MKKATIVLLILLIITVAITALVCVSYKDAYADELIPPPATTPYPGQVLPCNPRLPECCIYYFYLPAIYK